MREYVRWNLRAPRAHIRQPDSQETFCGRRFLYPVAGTPELICQRCEAREAQFEGGPSMPPKLPRRRIANGRFTRVSLPDSLAIRRELAQCLATAGRTDRSNEERDPMQRKAYRHLLDTRRPRGRTIGRTASSQLPVICELDIIDGTNYGGDDAVTDTSAVTCPACRRHIAEVAPR